MPTGTRSSIKANSTMKPVMATTSGVMARASYRGRRPKALSSSAKADDPVTPGFLVKNKGRGLLDAPLSRGMTLSSSWHRASFHCLRLRLGGAQILRVEDQPPGTDSDQQHGRYVARPRDREERPGRQMEVDGQDIVVAGGDHLVEQGVGLHRDHEQQHQGGEHVDDALPPRPHIGPNQVDRNMAAAIARRR